jgi:hypothetical protein
MIMILAPDKKKKLEPKPEEVPAKEASDA